MFQAQILMKNRLPNFFKAELDQRRIAEIQFFFGTYDQFSGKDFRVLGTGGPEQARQLVLSGEAKFADKRKA